MENEIKVCSICGQYFRGKNTICDRCRPTVKLSRHTGQPLNTMKLNDNQITFYKYLLVALGFLFLFFVVPKLMGIEVLELFLHH